MPITDPRERKILTRVAEAIDVAVEALNAAHSEIVTERTLDAFGTDYVGQEDLESIMAEPELKRIAAVLDELETKAQRLRSQLADDGSDPPF